MALAHYERSEHFTDAERLVLRLADRMSDTPSDVPQELFDALREHYEDAQIVELASSLAWENYRARFNRVFDVGSEGYSEGAYCPVPVGLGEAGSES